jgi:hypothetical protein
MIVKAIGCGRFAHEPRWNGPLDAIVHPGLIG